MNKKAIILLSGGIDSATCLAIAIRENYSPHCLTFNYKQKHSIEVKYAKKLCKFFKIKEHKIININLREIGGSALTANIPVPKDRRYEEIKLGIPITYVPARNTIFLSYALAWAEVIECNDIFIGVNAIDFSGYPDCRPEYIKKFEELANLACKSAVEGKMKIIIHTPLINLKKSEIITKAHQLGIDFKLTHSCYDPSPEGAACGRCDSCLLRLKGFLEAGLQDPIHYSRE